MISQERLKELLSYDAESGLFTWVKTNTNCVKVGSRAGKISNSEGYSEIQIDGKVYKAHRLAWLYVYGHHPKHQIDHIDGVRSNNAICNLRESTKSENMQNQGLCSRNKSGHQGIHWSKAAKKWKAVITHQGKEHYLGVFQKLTDALNARLAAKESLHTFNPSQNDTVRQKTGYL